MKIIADDKIPFLRGVLEPFAEVSYIPGSRISNAMLLDADALLTRSITLCNADLLKQTKVKLIASATIGDDHIDHEYCKNNGIKWVTAKGCNAEAVEQYVITALFEIAARFSFELKEKTIGIIGVGNIGARIQRVSSLLGMNVLLNDPPRERVEGNSGFNSLEEIEKSSDIISFHVPLTNHGVHKTLHLAGNDFFKKIKKGAHIINTSRGAVIDSQTMIRSIKENSLGSVTLDVWENEPDIDHELLGLTTLATPHIAGYSLEGKMRGTAMTVQQLSKFFDLELGSWFPDIRINQETIGIDCESCSAQEVIRKIFQKVYDLKKDDRQLRENVENFESLRRNYNLRKGFSDFKLELANCCYETTQIIELMGFNITKN